MLRNCQVCPNWRRPSPFQSQSRSGLNRRSHVVTRQREAGVRWRGPQTLGRGWLGDVGSRRPPAKKAAKKAVKKAAKKAPAKKAAKKAVKKAVKKAARK